jgi:hypothetical protein
VPGADGKGRYPGWRLVARVLFAGSLHLAGCTYDVTLGDVTSHPLAALSCGTWDSLGAHATGVYFVGHTTAQPDDTLSYFVFDLTPVAGLTLTAASLTLPGTADWKITVAGPVTPALQFKLGTTPLPASLTLARVTGKSGDTGVYAEVHAEQDLGFGWVSSGSDANTYDAFHYDGARLQDAVNAGGLYPLFAVQRFGEDAATDEYLYGGGVFGPDIVLHLTTE